MKDFICEDCGKKPQELSMYKGYEPGMAWLCDKCYDKLMKEMKKELKKEKKK